MQGPEQDPPPPDDWRGPERREVRGREGPRHIVSYDLISYIM